MNKDLALLKERIDRLENGYFWASILLLLMFGLLTYLFAKVEGLL